MAVLLASDRIRWVVAAAAAVLMMAVFVALFRLPPAPLPDTPLPSRATSAAPPTFEIAQSATGGAVLREELELRDMRPLFLPTPRNSATLPEPRREPGRAFLGEQTVKFSFNETDLAVSDDFPPIVTIGKKPAHEARAVDLLEAERVAGLSGFGRNEVSSPPMPVRGGFVEVVALATGRTVLTEELAPEARPPGDKPWEPMELLATVDAAGLVAPLVVTNSSRVEEVDAHYRIFLARRFRIGERLSPGFYRVLVGP